MLQVYLELKRHQRAVITTERCMLKVVKVGLFIDAEVRHMTMSENLKARKL